MAMAHGDPNWLEALQRDIAEITGPAAREFWPNPDPTLPAFFNYRLEHVRQVEREALRLLAAVGGDREVTLAAVWLHDRFQPAFAGEDHGPRAADWARENLARLGFATAKVEAVAFAVAHHSDRSGEIPAEAHEARLLWDADKLAHTGPTEVVNLLMNHLATDHLARLGADPAHPERLLTLQSLSSVLDRFASGDPPGKRFYFQVSARWADERFAAAQQFCEGLAAQASMRTPPRPC